MKRLYIKFVKFFGWKLNLPEKGSRPEMERCVFVVAPHTSAFDFIFGVAFLWSCCSNGRVFIKKEFFRWPLGPVLRRMGGITVDRGNRKNDMVGTAVREFNKQTPFSLAITPEGTRKPTNRWKRGFWEIAHQANVPIVLTYVDFKNKEIGAFDTTIWTSDNYEEDLKKIRKCYRSFMAKYPENFIELN